MIKGYVVRGQCDGNQVHATSAHDTWCGDHAVDGCACPLLPSVGKACSAWTDLIACGCTDVCVFAVADDGTETPLPTYEEALAALDAACRLATMAQADIDKRDLGEAIPHEWYVLCGVLAHSKISDEARRLLAEGKQ